MPENVTIDEIFRLLTDVKHEHGRQLEAIHKQTTETNGMVGRHAERLDNNDREIKTLKVDFSRIIWAIIGLVVSVVSGVVIVWSTRQ